MRIIASDRPPDNPPDESADAYASTAVAADLIGISESYLHGLILRGHVSYVRINRRDCVSIAEVESVVDRLNPARAATEPDRDGREGRS